MPRNNGVYTLPSVYLAQDGETIQPNQHNIPLQDIAQALTGSVPRDGTAAMTGDLPMNGRKVTGLGAATAPGDAVRLDQVVPNTGWLASVSSLTMAADRIPYATGAATAALAVFTAAGRAIVGAADAAAQRLALGLGALATKDKVAVADIDATGTAGAATFLRGDGSWGGVFGVGQSTQNVMSSRVSGATYQNTTGRPIFVSVVQVTNNGNNLITFEVSSDGTTWLEVDRDYSHSADFGSVEWFVLPNQYYRVTLDLSVRSWVEIR